MTSQKILEIIGELFEDRGYSKPREYEDEKCKALINEKTIVFFPDDPSFRINSCTHLFSLMEEMKLNHAIIVYTDKITTQTNSLLNSQLPDDIRVELFRTNTLLFNPCRHKYVPPHVKVDPSELGKKVKAEDLPPLPSYDPVVKFKGFQVGDIIRIDRFDGVPAYKVVREIAQHKSKKKKDKKDDFLGDGNDD